MVTTFRHPGHVLAGHVLAVPLGQRRPDGEQTEVLARELPRQQAGTRPGRDAAGVLGWG